MDTQEAAPSAPGPAPTRPYELVELAPFVVLVACFVARWAGVAQAEVEPIEIGCCLLINPSKAGRS